MIWCDCDKHGGAGLRVVRQAGRQQLPACKTVAAVARRPWIFSKGGGHLFAKLHHDLLNSLVLSGLLPVTAEQAVMAGASPMPMKSSMCVR